MEVGQHILTCPHPNCSKEVLTPEGICIEPGNSVPMNCPLCGGVLVFIYLPRKEDYIKVLALDTEMMMGSDATLEKNQPFIKGKVWSYLEKAGLLHLYLEAKELPTESEDGSLILSITDLSAIPIGMEEAIRSFVKAPTDMGLDRRSPGFLN